MGDNSSKTRSIPGAETSDNSPFDVLGEIEDVLATFDLIEALVCAIDSNCSNLRHLSREVTAIPSETVDCIVCHIQAFSSIIDDYRGKSEKELTRINRYIRKGDRSLR